MHKIATALNELSTELNALFHERTDTIEAMLLAVLAKEHVYILGPPGTGKSLLVDTMVSAFTGSRYFECAMSKTRSADAVLGPLDILEFRQNGHLWRKRKGFITDAHFAFVDEIGKMSPILGHDLLALFNERKVHEVNGGLSVQQAPLYTVFTASNEMLTDESDDAAALWDRLLFRTTVDYIKSGKNFASLLQSAMGQVKTQIDFDELAKAIDVDVPAVTLGTDALKAILTLRKNLADKGIVPSDRRWRASIKALKAAAFLAGRDEIYEEDMAALRFTLWDTIPQIEEISRLTAAASNPFVDRVLEARTLLKEISTGITDRKDKAIAEKASYAKEIDPKLRQVRADLDTLLDEAKGRAIPKFKEVADLHRDTLKRMFVDCFGIDGDAADHAIAAKLGKGDGSAA